MGEAVERGGRSLVARCVHAFAVRLKMFARAKPESRGPLTSVPLGACRCVSIPLEAGNYRAVSALGCEGSALVTDEPGT